MWNLETGKCGCTSMNVQKLIEDNMNLVYFVVNKYYPTFIGDEDIIQSGMLGLCRAANTWDESRATFSTYAAKCILNHIRIELRLRKKHYGVLSLDYKFDSEVSDSNDILDVVIGEEDVDYVDYKSFYDQLSPMDKLIVTYRRQGLTHRQIAEKLNCTRQNVTKHLQKLEYKWRTII